MDRGAFMAWRAAFNAFLDCGASGRPKAQCVAFWRRDAARFIPAGRAPRDKLFGMRFHIVDGDSAARTAA